MKARRQLAAEMLVPSDTSPQIPQPRNALLKMSDVQRVLPHRRHIQKLSNRVAHSCKLRLARVPPRLANQLCQRENMSGSERSNGLQHDIVPSIALQRTGRQDLSFRS